MTSSVTPLRILASDCLTPFGHRAATHAALVRGERALTPVAVGGGAGGDPVPLALLPGRKLDETAPPSWLAGIRRLLEPIGDRAWGTVRYPVIMTSSNFGVGNLLSYRRTGDRQHVAYGAPFLCVDWLRRELGWGESVTIYSHACVSAHLGLLQASRLVESGWTEQALVFSFDFLSPFVAGGFHSLKILNAEMPAPYQERAVGAIGLGDGAAFAVVGRGTAGVKLEAQALHNESYHFTANQPGGEGFGECLRALRAAADGRKVWIKGHGTGTLEAGRMEAKAFSTFFPRSPLVGWKGSLGHTLGSCGLVELAVVLESLQQGSAPGTVGSTAPLMVETVSLVPVDVAGYEGVICASNAFGGAHAGFLLSHD